MLTLCIVQVPVITMGGAHTLMMGGETERDQKWSVQVTFTEMGIKQGRGGSAGKSAQLRVTNVEFGY